MFLGNRTQDEAQIIAFPIAVFCLDCEAISNSRNDSCSACQGRSLVSVAKLLHGSLPARRARVHQKDTQQFDATITIELERIEGRDVSTVIEDLNHITGLRLAQGSVSIHLNVQPSAVKSRAAKRAA